MVQGTPLLRFTGRPSKAERRPVPRFLRTIPPGSLPPSPLEGLRAPAPLGWGSGQGTPPPTPPGGGRVGPWSSQPACKPRAAGKPYRACWVPAPVGR